MKRRYIVPVLAALAVVCVLLALAWVTDFRQEKAGPEPITLTFYNADGIEDTWSDPVAQAITAATGVTLQVDYPSNAETNRVALMIATGEYPDLIYAKSDARLLLDHGALLDMSPLIETYGENIRKLYGDALEDLRVSADNPAIYQLCSDKAQHQALETSGTAQLQWVVLRENGYAIPRTLEEYTDMILRYLQAHPTINGKRTIGLSIACMDWHWYTTLSILSGNIASGSADNGQWVVKDGAAYYKHALSEQRDYYRWLNSMYHEGILDPEFATQTHEDYIDKIAQGRVLGLLDSDWGYAEAENALRAQGESERTYAGMPVTMDESVACASLKPTRLATGWGIGISKSCKDPVRAIRFLDWMCSEEAQILNNWGVEGIHYTYDEQGKRVRSQAEINDSRQSPDYAARTGVAFQVYPYPSYGNMAVDSTGNPYTRENREDIIASYDDIEREALAAWGVDMLIDLFQQPEDFDQEEPYPPLRSLQLPDTLNSLVSALDAVAWPGLIDCIVCPQEAFDEAWDGFQQALRDAGLGEANRQMNALLAEKWPNRTHH